MKPSCFLPEKRELLALICAALALSACKTDPNAGKMMEDHQERKKQVQTEQEFAKTLPPTQAPAQYKP